MKLEATCQLNVKIPPSYLTDKLRDILTEELFNEGVEYAVKFADDGTVSVEIGWCYDIETVIRNFIKDAQ